MDLISLAVKAIFIENMVLAFFLGMNFCSSPRPSPGYKSVRWQRSTSHS